jgi:signal transduction histidine kinase
VSESAPLAVTCSVRALVAWWRSRSELLQDSALAALFLAIGFIPSLQANGLALGELAHHPLGVPGSLLIVAQTVPLAVRRRWPAWSLGVVAVAFALFQLGGYVDSPASTSVIVSLYSVGAHAVTHRRALAWAITAGYAVLATVLALRGSPERPIDWLTFYLLLVVCWGAGGWVRSRAAAERQRRRQNVELAMAAERARIARELHDVVTHHVTAMVVQADAAQFVLADAPDRAADGLTAVSGTGRRALAELRHLLGVLESPKDPRDVGELGSTGTLADLVTQLSSAGHPAELIEKGQPEPMAAGTRLAVYRVVQEGLTNSMKHAPGQPVVAQVRYGDDEITIEVRNDGPVVGAGAFTAGRGLTGLRERVSHCGGELLATGRPDGGFTLGARMPRHPAQLDP